MLDQSLSQLIIETREGSPTPITLELSGKCPSIIAPDRVTEETCSEILSIKAVKSGQVCINTD